VCARSSRQGTILNHCGLIWPMAWEWVAPVCTAVVGLGGIVATYLTGRESRDSAAKQADEQRRSTADAALRADRLKAYSEFVAAFWESMAKNNTAFLMGKGAVSATQEEKSRAISEAQTAHGRFTAASQAAYLLGGSPIMKALPVWDRVISQRFAGALKAVRGEDGAFQVYNSAWGAGEAADFRALYEAMKSELGVTAKTSDLDQLVDSFSDQLLT
jgi:hypothetical protein